MKIAQKSSNFYFYSKNQLFSQILLFYELTPIMEQSNLSRPLVIPKKLELIPIPIPATVYGFNSNSNSKILVRINSNSHSNSNSGQI